MKKHSMKMIVTLLSLLLLLTSVGILSGCLTESDKRRFDTELFKCMYNEDNTGVIILELTEKGQEQEILVIPEEINGLPVVQLGGDTIGYPYVKGHTLQSDKVKKIYCIRKNGIWNTPYNNFKCQHVVDIVVNKESIASFNPAGNKCNCCFYSNIIDEIENDGMFLLNRCNVFFYADVNNDSEEYWFDIINGNNYHVIPNTPQKEGFLFLGWYLDKEYTIVWDESFSLPEGRNELNLYAKWTKK